MSNSELIQIFTTTFLIVFLGICIIFNYLSDLRKKQFQLNKAYEDIKQAIKNIS